MTSCAPASFHTASWVKKIQRIGRVVFENQIRVVSVGKMRPVSRFLHGYSYLSTRLHLGSKNLEGKRTTACMALKYKAVSDIKELGMELVNGISE